MDAQSKQEFLELYKDAHEPLARFCMAKSYGIMDPSDLLSETVLAALEGFDKLRNKQAFLSYLFTIANNKVNAVLRRKKFSGPYEEQTAHSQIDTNGASDARFDIGMLYEALNELPKSQKEAVILFEISGFSIKEIMEIQNSGESAVKQRLKRGREKLAALFNEDKRKAMAGVAILLLSQNANSTPSIDSLFEIARGVEIPISQEQIVAIINNYQAVGLASSSSFTQVAHLGLSGISALTIVAVVCFNGGTTSLGANTEVSKTTLPQTEQALVETTSLTNHLDASDAKNEASYVVCLSDMEALPAHTLGAHPNALEIMSTVFPTLNFDTKNVTSDQFAPTDTTKHISQKSDELVTGSTIKARLWEADVEVVFWDKDYADVQSDISFDAKNEKSREIANDNLSVSVQKNGNELRIIGKTCSNYAVSPFKKYDKWTFNDGEKAYIRNVEMRHTLYVPKDVKLNLDIAYGDLTLPTIENDLIIKVSEGKLVAGDIHGKIDLRLRYSDAEMGSIKSGKISLFESNLNFNEGEDIDLNSKYSDLISNKLNKVKIEGYEGKFLVEDVKELEGNMRYMKCSSKVMEQVDLNIFESQFTAESVQKLRVNSSYTKYDIKSLGTFELPKSYEDDFEIENLEWMEGACRYSRVIIDQLAASADLTSFDGRVEIGKVSKSFQGLTFDGRYTNYQVDFENQSSYELQVNARYTGLKYPESKSSVNKWVDENDTVELNCHVNKSGAKDAVVKFTCIEGNIALAE